MAPPQDRLDPSDFEAILDNVNRNPSAAYGDRSFCRSGSKEPIAYLISLALVAVITLGVYCYDSVFDEKSSTGKKNDTQDSNGNRTSAQGTRQKACAQNAFAVSSAHILAAHEALGGIGPTDSWTGGSGAGYQAQNAVFTNQLRRVARANQDVDATVQTQGEQVKNTRESLGNIANGLQAAIPVAQALYFSGPAGPALSFNFQLSVATPAMSTATETTNTMEQNAQGHAKRLTALTQEYCNAFQAISTTDYASAPTSQFGAAITVDPSYIKNLAPIHQQAADTFAAAANMVGGSAEAISTAHGRVCDASKAALANAEQAHNTLAAAMHKYSTGLAAALPAVAEAYASTDAWATKNLNSQLA